MDYLLPVIALFFWISLILLVMRGRAKKDTLEGIVTIMSLVKVTYMCIVIVSVLVCFLLYFFGYWPIASVLFMVLSILCALIYGYIITGLLESIELNYILTRYYRNGIVVDKDDKATITRLRRFLRCWSWLHKLLFWLRGIAFSDVLQRVFPSDNSEK